MVCKHIFDYISGKDWIGFCLFPFFFLLTGNFFIIKGFPTIVFIFSVKKLFLY